MSSYCRRLPKYQLNFFPLLLILVGPLFSKQYTFSFIPICEACKHTVNFYLSFWSQLKSHILMISSSLVWFVSHVPLHIPCHLIHILYYIIYCTILICLSFCHVHTVPSCDNTSLLLIFITEPIIFPVKQSGKYLSSGEKINTFVKNYKVSFSVKDNKNWSWF